LRIVAELLEDMQGGKLEFRLHDVTNHNHWAKELGEVIPSQKSLKQF